MRSSASVVTVGTMAGTDTTVEAVLEKLAEAIEDGEPPALTGAQLEAWNAATQRAAGIVRREAALRALVPVDGCAPTDF
jgi:ATP-dependent exoDNAse (exonuclease V) alpha subunit